MYSLKQQLKVFLTNNADKFYLSDGESFFLDARIIGFIIKWMYIPSNQYSIINKIIFNREIEWRPNGFRSNHCINYKVYGDNFQAPMLSSHVELEYV